MLMCFSFERQTNLQRLGGYRQMPSVALGFRQQTSSLLPKAAKRKPIAFKAANDFLRCIARK